MAGQLRHKKQLSKRGRCIAILPGQYFDRETEWYYNWHRYYNPFTGRYITADPLGFDGGDINIYVYASNRPLVFIDELGLACGSIKSDKWVPDIPYGFDFTKACENHDACYGKCGNLKSFCDKAFLEDMYKECNKHPNYYPMNVRQGCKRIALDYYMAVVAFGKDPYCEGQSADGCCPKECN